MMKILLVDDEALARIEIRSMIPWGGRHNYDLCGEASNGKEAIKLAALHKPDIIITDIVMPEMDGLTFMEEIKKELPFCRFIIVSCMNKIDFYKKAISLNVSEYILKDTIQIDEFLQMLEQIAVEIEKTTVYLDFNKEGKNFINKYAILNEFLNHVFENKIKNEAAIQRKFELFDIHFSSKCLYVMVFAIDQLEEHDSGYDGSFDDSIVTLCQAIISRMGGGYIYKNKDNVIVTVFSCPLDGDAGDFIRNSFNSVKGTVYQYLDLNITAGISGAIHHFGGLYEGYQEALKALDQRFYERIGQVIFRNRSEVDNAALSMAMEEMKQQILSVRSVYEWDQLKLTMEKVYAMLLEQSIIPSAQVKDFYMVTLIRINEMIRQERGLEHVLEGDYFNASEMVAQARFLSTLNQCIMSLIDRVQIHLSSKLERKQSQIVQEINHFIEQNLDRKPSLKELSQKVHCSREYICRLYKKETGENLNHYIVRRKIEKSKELLLSNCSITEVTGALGFTTDSYFIRLFKTHTGRTPSQYVNESISK